MSTDSRHQLFTPGIETRRTLEFYGEPQSVLDRISLGPIGRADTEVMYGLWEAAKAEAKAEGHPVDLDAIARRTEDIVDKTQPTWNPLTISSLAREGRSNPLVHLLVMFSSQRNKNFNVAVRGIAEFSQS